MIKTTKKKKTIIVEDKYIFYCDSCKKKFVEIKVEDIDKWKSKHLDTPDTLIDRKVPYQIERWGPEHPILGMYYAKRHTYYFCSQKCQKSFS